MLNGSNPCESYVLSRAPSPHGNAGLELYEILSAQPQLIPQEWKKSWGHLLFAGDEVALKPEKEERYIPTLWHVSDFHSEIKSKYYREWLACYTKINKETGPVTQYYNVDLKKYFWYVVKKV